MPLPSSLQSSIETFIKSINVKELTKAREELTRRYRTEFIHDKKFIENEAQRQAYLISRVPATYAAVDATLKAIKERGHLSIKNVLDLGAGPGTAAWAVCEHFTEIENVTLFEKDPSMIMIGKQLAQNSEFMAMPSAVWQECDLEKLTDLPPQDLVVLSYSIGELKQQLIIPFIEMCWKATKQLLLIVEPGTPNRFENIRLIRRHLIEIGGHIIAPCPHHVACPMAGGDWCHFSARLERSALHRRLKGGELGYEDEKYSYVAATRNIYPFPATRVLSQPERHSGHVSLKLCTDKGVQRPIISKKMGDLYKHARKVEWGDTFPM